MTLSEILAQIGAYTDQSTDIPTGDELSVRVSVVGQALQEWGNAYQWKQLRIPYSTTVVAGVSIGLPANFKKMMSIAVDTSLPVSNNREYKEIRAEDRFNKVETDKYFYITGDPSTGRVMNIFPSLASGTPIKFDYQSFPSSMATLNDICVCPHPEFITKRAIGFMLEIRSDTRFPQVKADADVLLSRMIEEEDSPAGSEVGEVRNTYDKGNFIIGW